MNFTVNGRFLVIMENNIQKSLRWICTALFPILCIGMIWFLQNFTKLDTSIQYIDWQTAVKIGQDDSLTELDYSVPPETGDRFRLETVIPANSKYGNLVFETAGMNLTVSIDEKAVWQSETLVPEGAARQTQAIIPLPLNTECKLTVIGTVTDTTSIIFPPFPRFVPVDAEEIESYAYANYYSIPAGATAFISLMIAGLFLLGIARKNADWSLIPLFLASVGLTMQWITKGMGHHFLDDGLVDFLNRQEIGILLLVLLIVYLVMNRQRKFWKYFGVSAAVSAVTLAVAYMVSFFTNSRLSKYIGRLISDVTEFYDYSGLLYWITVWTVAVCAVISAYAVTRSIISQQMEAKTLRLRNELIMNSYHAIESKVTDSAAIRHEMKHKIIALDALYQKGDYKTLGQLIGDIKQQNDHLAQTQFTENFTVNTILQDAAYRAAQSDIRFDVLVSVPPQLTVAESDLCELLMNMLDNALEATAEVTDGKRFVRFQIETKNGFLAVKCENSYSGKHRQDADGNYLTTKNDAETHGFGLKLMNTVAVRYHSILDIFTSEDRIFTVQTALKLPKK